MRVGRVVMLVLGVLAVLGGLGLLAGGGVLGWAYLTQRDDDGFLTTPTERYESDGFALLSEPIDVTDPDDVPFGFDSDDVGRVRVTAEPAPGNGPLFVGIGRGDAVEGYLGDVRRTEVSQVHFGPFELESEDREGGPPPNPPGDEGFWEVSSSGPGTRQVTWEVEEGSWSVVVMNADGSSPVAADLEAGGRFRFLGPVTIGLLVVGFVVLLVGVVLVVAGARGLGRSAAPPSPPADAAPPA